MDDIIHFLMAEPYCYLVDIFFVFLVFGVPVILIVVFQWLLFQCRKTLFHYFLLLAAPLAVGLTAILYKYLYHSVLVLESACGLKFYIFNYNWFNSEPWSTGLVLFCLSELVAWSIHLFMTRKTHG